MLDGLDGQLRKSQQDEEAVQSLMDRLIKESPFTLQTSASCTRQSHTTSEIMSQICMHHAGQMKAWNSHLVLLQSSFVRAAVLM